MPIVERCCTEIHDALEALGRRAPFDLQQKAVVQHNVDVLLRRIQAAFPGNAYVASLAQHIGELADRTYAARGCRADHRRKIDIVLGLVAKEGERVDRLARAA